MPPHTTHASPWLPPDDPQRTLLHNEVHARPSASIALPALVVMVAVLNDGVSREDECAHLRHLPGQQGLQAADLADHFLRLELGALTLKWERHTEFTRYTLIQPLGPSEAMLDLATPQVDLMAHLQLDAGWLRGVPGRTVAAIELLMLAHDITDPQRALPQAERWFDDPRVVASLLGRGHSMAVTNFWLRPGGLERVLVLAQPGTSPARAGRIAQRLLELEVYRLMALRALPTAKALSPLLAESEAALAEVTAQLETRLQPEGELLQRLIHVAAGVERATAEHQFRFSATQAYDALVRQRIGELREAPIQGTQTLGEFMQRRLSPAIGTVAATSARLASLSQRIERASALLRTRVDIATETQNQQLLAKLTRGQELQLQLQSTVEGLSIAAISYYVVSLLLYGVKALKSAGLPLNAELTAGALMPLVIWAVWKTTQRVHARLHR